MLSEQQNNKKRENKIYLMEVFVGVIVLSLSNIQYPFAIFVIFFLIFFVRFGSFRFHRLTVHDRQKLLYKTVSNEHVIRSRAHQFNEV